MGAKDLRRIHHHRGGPLTVCALNANGVTTTDNREQATCPRCLHGPEKISSILPRAIVAGDRGRALSIGYARPARLAATRTPLGEAFAHLAEAEDRMLRAAMSDDRQARRAFLQESAAQARSLAARLERMAEEAG